ncbi:MAG: hypothetical protein ACD_66C00206G0002 [uncultured bacterium]|uniref:DUF304 domain-containing protein n=1 Tax=Candidatus Uhrbacteria bacterium GW2011_GWC1_41_20 TaxID=1618983 RepID=A0A0G0VED3_9BACT|nr:MAG: hypothetical protein ACD_66C00206G0002 [uncultured bacterium]KKR22614.1 MAG: hypothetical protein UT52_C0010G0027 [Candidatus Uhrbacteria bacterium GW2011_GWE1_39_46]KKR63916.1 MAG: hypothetical protein UU04_C0009G0025 [Candidatus Uhrbacteria bacterium GW2011_GWC2_40_450]KKR90172.1 MAG: hypothetical protein UU40_C0007G0027 [Candidatus Uhrbacteria bacterium GW2011_GWD2_41_121]KKR90543.1 MAG: hypothetical protein UU36_C0004G0005 [Candidatus Uhrbacteria bacterium GW2011_GWE2_41_1153]KKR96
MQQSSIELHTDEHVLAVVRSSFLREFGRFVFATLLLLVPFFFFFPLMKLGAFGLLLFVIVEGFAILYFGRLWISWYYTLLIITEERVIDTDQQGLFKREIIEIDIDDVSDSIIEKQRLLSRILGIAGLRIKTDKLHEFDIYFPAIRQANRVQELLREVQSSQNQKSSKQKHQPVIYGEKEE